MENTMKMKNGIIEKLTFPWDSVMTMNLKDSTMFIHDTNIEVKWDPILEKYIQIN
tara:strand:+ start:1262 stop:1426 length:165 start_codon:yes stop_codon:yes gene_type:complete